MRFNIIGSIVLTLILMLVCSVLNLGFFGSIIMMIIFFSIFNYRYLIRNKFRGLVGFSKYSNAKIRFVSKTDTESQEQLNRRTQRGPLDGMEL